MIDFENNQQNGVFLCAAKLKMSSWLEFLFNWCTLFDCSSVFIERVSKFGEK